MSRIAVIIPVYKVEPYLKRCVDSVLVQSFDDLRVVLVDDGSPDACGAICDEYAVRDARVKVIHQENGGLSRARNAALDWLGANEQPEWVFFLDGDDAISPDCLRCLYEAAVARKCEAAVAGFRSVDANELPKPAGDAAFAACTPDSYWNEHFWGAIVAWGKLYAFPLFNGVRYPAGRLHEDLYVTHQVLFACSSIAVTDAELYCYCRRPDSIMGSPLTTARAEDQLAGSLAQCAFLAKEGHLDALSVTLDLLTKAINEARMCGGDVRSAKRQLAQYVIELRAGGRMPVARHYDTYHLLHPWIINSYTWRILRAFLRQKTERTLEK